MLKQNFRNLETDIEMIISCYNFPTINFSNHLLSNLKIIDFLDYIEASILLFLSVFKFSALNLHYFFPKLF